jgi:FAD-linked sulfhydryl oxidase
MININPILWGPNLWNFMHYLTLSYPDQPTEYDINKFKNFFTTIGEYLPCEKCRNNYKDHLQELPLTINELNSRDNLVLWLFNLHNVVNKHLGKKEFTLKEFNDVYVNNMNIHTNSNTNTNTNSNTNIVN